MWIELHQLCSIKGNEGCKVTHICVNHECKEISRNMCDKCINENIHNNCNSFNRNYHIEIENFM